MKEVKEAERLARQRRVLEEIGIRVLAQLEGMDVEKMWEIVSQNHEKGKRSFSKIAPD